MGPPAQIRINGWPIKITSVPLQESSEDAGEFDGGKGVIKIRDDQEGLHLIDTVLHEVLHGILFHQGREPGCKKEEPYVRAIATGLTGFLSDNPDFLKWLVTSFHNTNIPTAGNPCSTKRAPQPSPK